MGCNNKPPILEYSNELYHYGVGHLDGGNSGRYPFGSGENPGQHSADFLMRVEKLKKDGWKETPENIKEAFGMTTSEYRAVKSLANDHRKIEKYETARRLSEREHLGATEIGKIMGINESSVRTMLQKTNEDRLYKQTRLVNFLKDQVNKKGMIDVGVGMEYELSNIMGVNITRTNLNNAIQALTSEGYHDFGGRYEQPTNPGKFTTIKVLATPEKEHKEIFDPKNISTISDYRPSDDKPKLSRFQYPASMDSKRLQIRYKEDGGIEKDGIIELRRGVADLDLGGDHYSQVRILVDGTHYLKGMAVYGDDKDFPKGVDVIFNTNKTKDVPMTKVLKPIKADPDNPFGSAIKPDGGQSMYIDKDGNEKLSLINKRAAEGDWDDWKDSVPSQFLSKQPITLAKRQLNLAKTNMADEFNSYMELTNPTVKKKLLMEFANKCDSTAVHLNAAALPGQKYHVIIAFPTMKDNEVYAPKYENGTKLALIRYPHGGTFEIPILTVNNNLSTPKKILGSDPLDAIGINSKVAERLSGADFDGDTVMCIPTHQNGIKINSTDELRGLKSFDPKTAYGADEEKYFDGKTHYYRNGKEYPLMTKKGTQLEMGKISNLITDMTIIGSTDDEKARAVRHSMVVIDAEKHHLDYKQSEKDNDIRALKLKYQGRTNAGASTLISRAKSEDNVPKQQGQARVNIPVNPITGKKNEYYDPTRPEGSLVFKVSDDLYYPERTKDPKTGMITLRTVDGKKIEYQGSKPDKSKFTKKEEEEYNYYNPVKKIDSKTGKITYTNSDGTIEYRLKMKHTTTTKMEKAQDAYTLMSSKEGTPMERVYADYANYMLDLGRRARIEAESTGKIAYNKSAANTYAKEVASLTDKLKLAGSNAPRERRAIMLSTNEIDMKKQSNPNMSKEELKKLRQQTMTKYRHLVGAERHPIQVTPKEWEAIQSGAIHETTLKKILDKTDTDVIKDYATPRPKNELSDSQKARIKAYSSNGNYTIEEIAKQMGISASTVTKYLK